MRSILVLCLLGGVFADYDWRPRKEYKFQLEGRSLAGVTSLNQQFTGVHYRGILVVQSQSSNVLAMKLQDMTYARVHSKLEGGWWGNIPEDETKYNKFPITESTFIAKIEKGVVESLVVSRKLPDWQVNFLQGLVAQLQLDISGSNVIRKVMDKSNSISGRGSPPEVFSVMENSVTGRCEVLYEVSPLPKSYNELATEGCGNRPLLEITKTRNHSNCELNPEYHFGLPHNLHCQPNGNQCGQFWTRSTLSRIIGCGSRSDLLLLATITSSRVFANLHLHNGTVAEANSNVNITLISARSLNKKLTPPTDPVTISHLQYKYTPTTPKSRDCSIKEKSGKNSTCIDCSDKDKKRRHNFDSTQSSSLEKETPKSRHKRSSKKKKPSSSKMNKSKDSSSHSSEESKQPEIHATDSEEKGLWSGGPQDDSPVLPFDALSLALRRSGEKSCLSEQLKDIVSDIGNDLDSADLTVEKSTLKKIVLATRVCHTMSQKDLRRSVGALMDAQVRDNKILMSERKAFRDIMTICGTNPAFEIVSSWIEEKKVIGGEAAAMISYIPFYLISPTKKTLDRFYELIRSSAMKGDRQLRATSVLAFSNTLRIACISQMERKMRFPYNVYGNPCEADSASRYIPYMVSLLRGDQAQRPAFLTALGNTGSLLALPALTAAARDNSSTPYLRARAITAMKHLVLSEPKAMAPVLLSLYDDKQAPELVRLTAVSMLFFSKPSLSTWQRIAVGTWFEPSPSIKTFIWSSLKALSGAKDGVTKEMSKAAASALPLARISAYPTRHHAHNILMTNVISDLQEVINNQIILFDGITGFNFYMRHINRNSGFSRVGVEADLWVANPDAFLRGLTELFYPDDDRMHNRPPLTGLSRTTHWLRENLKIAPRTGPKMEGDFHMRLYRLVEWITAMNNSSIADLSKATKRLPEQLKTGKAFHKQSLDLSYFEMSTTTDMGFAVSFQVYNPWILRTTGAANLSKDSPQHATAEFSFTYGEDLHSEISLYTPFDGVQHVAAHHSQRLFTPPPIRLSGKRNQTGDAINVSMWSLRPIDNTTTVFSEIQRPFTVQRDAAKITTDEFDKNAKIIHTEDSTSGEMSSIEPFTLKYNRELASSPSGATMDIDLFRPLTILGYSFIWPSLHASSVEVLMNSFPEINMEFGMGRASVKGGKVNLLKTFPVTETQKKQTADSRESEEPTDTTTTAEYTSTTSVPTTTAEAVAYTQADEPTTETDDQDEEDEEDKEDATTVDKAETTNQTVDRGVFKVYQINTDNPVGDFNASSMDVFEHADSGSRMEYILKRMLSEIDSGDAYVIGFVVSSGEAQPASPIAAYVGVSSEITRRLCRSAIFMSNHDQSIGITQIMHWSAAPIMNLEEILRANLSSRFYMDVAKTESEPWSIKGSMMRSARKAAVLRTKRFAENCLGKSLNLQTECRNIFREASTLDRYNFTLHSKEGARTLQNSHLLSAVKYGLYPYMSEERFDDMNAANVVNIMIDVCRTNDCVDGFLKFPDENIHFDRVPTSYLITSSLLMNPVEGFFASIKDSSFCSLEHKKMVTFDGVTFEPSLSNCWHLLAKDCSGVSRVAMSVKKSQNGTNLEVNLDNYRVLRLSPGPRAEVNGLLVEITVNQIAEVSDLANTTLMVITKGMDQAIGVKIPTHGFDIIYANSGVLIKADTSLRGRLCGLCGDYDGQQVGEMKKPDAEVATSAKEFTASYEIKSGGPCSGGQNE